MENASFSGEDYEFLDADLHPFSFSGISQQTEHSQYSQAPEVDLRPVGASGLSKTEESPILASFSDYNSYLSQHSQRSQQAESGSPVQQGEDMHAHEASPIVCKNAFQDVKLLNISPVEQLGVQTEVGTAEPSVNALESRDPSFSTFMSPVMHTAAREADYEVAQHLSSSVTGSAQNTPAAVESPSILIPIQLSEPDKCRCGIPARHVTAAQESAPDAAQACKPVNPPLEPLERDSSPECRQREFRVNVFPLLHISAADRLQEDANFDLPHEMGVDWAQFANQCRGMPLSRPAEIRQCRNFSINGRLIKGVSASALVNPRNRISGPQQGFE